MTKGKSLWTSTMKDWDSPVRELKLSEEDSKKLLEGIIRKREEGCDHNNTITPPGVKKKNYIGEHLCCIDCFEAVPNPNYKPLTLEEFYRPFY